MTSWLIAAALGIAAVGIQYGLPRATAPGRVLLALSRAASLTLAVALLLNAPLGRSRPVMPWVFVDGSLSMTRAKPTLWRTAWDSAADAGSDSAWVFGDSVGPGDARSQPSAALSLVAPAVDRAMSTGHPAVLITDGEVQDSAALNDLVSGSRVIVLDRRASSDAAVLSLDAPRAGIAGDSIELRVTIGAAGQGSPAGVLAVQLDDKPVLRSPLEAMSAWSEREVALRIPTSGVEGTRILRVIVATPNDDEPRNDTLATAIELSRAASAVFASTSPDQDSRFALSVLRGVLALPTKGYLRVAPGVWREEGTLAGATEAQVRQSLRDAPIAVLHGDTGIFGPPASITRGPLALMVPADSESGEWYASATPASPLGALLAAVPLDSLPPVTAGRPPASDWTALEVRRGRGGVPRAIVTGRESPRRRVTVTASGLWRWRFRGGVSADAYASLWGGIFDWLAAERTDRRAVLPDAGVIREGDAIHWHRGSSADTLVNITLRRRDDATGSLTRALRFSSDVAVAEMQAPRPGIYEVDVPGGRTTIVVNESAELLPARARLQSGRVGRRAPPATAPGARNAGWLYVLLVALLCAEWIGRRRAGLR